MLVFSFSLPVGNLEICRYTLTFIPFAYQCRYDYRYYYFCCGGFGNVACSHGLNNITPVGEVSVVLHISIPSRNVPRLLPAWKPLVPWLYMFEFLDVACNIDTNILFIFIQLYSYCCIQCLGSNSVKINTLGNVIKRIVLSALSIEQEKAFFFFLFFLG